MEDWSECRLISRKEIEADMKAIGLLIPEEEIIRLYDRLSFQSYNQMMKARDS